jgi:hypothetical protein
VDDTADLTTDEIVECPECDHTLVVCRCDQQPTADRRAGGHQAAASIASIAAWWASPTQPQPASSNAVNVSNGT